MNIEVYQILCGAHIRPRQPCWYTNMYYYYNRLVEGAQEKTMKNFPEKYIERLSMLTNETPETIKQWISNGSILKFDFTAKFGKIDDPRQAASPGAYSFIIFKNETFADFIDYLYPNDLPRWSLENYNKYFGDRVITAKKDGFILRLQLR